MTQIELDITARKHKNADTSVAAFNSTPPSVRTRMRDQILALLCKTPMTTDEVSRVLGIPYTAASARMSELKRDGLIRDSGKRRPTANGRLARVMEVR